MPTALQLSVLEGLRAACSRNCWFVSAEVREDLYRTTYIVYVKNLTNKLKIKFADGYQGYPVELRQWNPAWITTPFYNYAISDNSWSTINYAFFRPSRFIRLQEMV